MKSSVPVPDSLASPAQEALPADRRLVRRWHWWLFLSSLLLNDFIMIALAFRIAFAIRFEWWLPIFNLEAPARFNFYQSFSFILIPIYLGIFLLSGLYHRNNLLGGTREYALVFRACTVAFLLVILAGFLDPQLIFARGWLLLVWMITFLFTSIGRFALRRVVYAFRGRGYLLTPALIIGANEEGAVVGEQLLGWHRSGLQLVGFVDDESPPGTPVVGRVQVLGDISSLPALVERHGVGELVIATSALPREKMLDIFQNFGVSQEVNLRLSSGLFEIITTGLQVKELAYVPLVQVNQVRLTGLNQALKTTLDYSLTALAMVPLVPVLALIALAIRLDSPGSVFYRRQVMGLNGRKFAAFKFRTMYIDGDEILAAQPELQARLVRRHKLKEDPRVTRLGLFLRKYSLDELPQLFNVLRGEMSLVGPRMISPPEMENYAKWGINLLTVRPGLTGLWQVSGRSDLSYADRVRLDMQYIRNWSIWTDLFILFQTIPVVLRGRGAY